MENLVLYRKYRPKSFAEVIGQEHVIKTVTNAIDANLTSHAYLFFGPRGSGKTTVARLLAKAVNCQNRQGFEPCNKCDSCLEITSNRAMDLIEIDAASHRGIDEMRDLREGIKFGPSKSKYKIFIIDEAHQLTKEAANALLKTLEEPPSYAIFILATTEIHKMIPTILSRCQRFDFRKLTIEEIIRKLEIICKQEKVKIAKEALELIALNSGGAIRDAESLLGQALTFSPVSDKTEISADDIKELLGLVDIKVVGDFFDLIVKSKKAEAIGFLEKIVEQGSDLQDFSKTLINYLRQTLILKIMGETKEKDKIITGLTKEEYVKLAEQTARLEEVEIRRIIKLFIEAENKIKYSSIPQLPLELAIAEAINQE
ncbi:MAG: DNA polymerase III subunit gamma/tau [bacterium]